MCECYIAGERVFEAPAKDEHTAEPPMADGAAADRRVNAMPRKRKQERR